MPDGVVTSTFNMSRHIACPDIGLNAEIRAQQGIHTGICGDIPVTPWRVPNRIITPHLVKKRIERIALRLVPSPQPTVVNFRGRVCHVSVSIPLANALRLNLVRFSGVSSAMHNSSSPVANPGFCSRKKRTSSRRASFGGT